MCSEDFKWVSIFNYGPFCMYFGPMGSKNMESGLLLGTSWVFKPKMDNLVQTHDFDLQIQPLLLLRPDLQGQHREEQHEADHRHVQQEGRTGSGV